MVNEIDQLVAAEKARADALIKADTKDASTNTPKPQAGYEFAQRRSVHQNLVPMSYQLNSNYADLSIICRRVRSQRLQVPQL